MTNAADPQYPDPRQVSGAFQLVIVVSLIATIVVCVSGSTWGLACAIPLVYYVVVIVRQARRLRDEALATLDDEAPTLPAEVVERRLDAVLVIYGGRRLPSVREQVARIRSRTAETAQRTDR